MSLQGRTVSRRHTARFYLLLIAAIVLVIVRATVDGMLYLLSAGVLLMIACSTSS
ncbi:hypothetical protein ACGFYQ_32340 [Streptomyces sp. NPDC048258]|uniref:hypothetical protein n=1 Tax=Streptomyces sp. NPDC048258 TaxID=3365527 RepID=UPI0037196B2E